VPDQAGETGDRADDGFATVSTPVPRISVTPANPAIGDSTAIGTQVAAYTVAMSDGSPFTSTVALTVNP
jgi:hypothetical protein